MSRIKEVQIEPPKGYMFKAQGELVEKRTRRVYCMFQPTLFKRIQIEAEKSGQSINDYIHIIMEEAVNKRKPTEFQRTVSPIKPS